MTCEASRQEPAAGHLRQAVVAIGALSVLLVSGLELLGVLDRLDGAVAGWVSRGGREGYGKELPEWVVWVCAVLFGFGLPWAMLASAGWWRRLVLWLSAVVLVAGWAPVLSLAAHRPEVAGPWTAVLWSGFCALIYAARHRMESETKRFDSR